MLLLTFAVFVSPYTFLALASLMRLSVKTRFLELSPLSPFHFPPPLSSMFTHLPSYAHPTRHLVLSAVLVAFSLVLGRSLRHGRRPSVWTPLGRLDLAGEGGALRRSAGQRW